VLTITVDTKDYLINEIDTAVDVEYTGWSYTTNLKALLQRFGIHDYRLKYRSCYYYRSTATFYSTKHQYIIAEVSSMKDRRRLLAHVVRRRIRVRRPPHVTCLPSLNLEFCKTPEEAVVLSTWGHVEFFATIGDECPLVKYKNVKWLFYDIREKSKLNSFPFHRIMFCITLSKLFSNHKD